MASSLGRARWARPESNWRSSPCQGDVITPRPRALAVRPTAGAYLSTSVRDLADDLRDLPSAARLRAESSESDATVGHADFLSVLDVAIGFAFQTKALDGSGGHDPWSWNLFKEVLSKNAATWAFDPLLGVEISGFLTEEWPSGVKTRILRDHAGEMCWIKTKLQQQKCV